MVLMEKLVILINSHEGTILEGNTGLWCTGFEDYSFQVDCLSQKVITQSFEKCSWILFVN